MKYAIDGPDGRVYSSADDWLEAIDMSIALSLKLGGEFFVVSLQGPLNFQRERERVRKAAKAYAEAVRTGTLVDYRLYSLNHHKLVLTRLLEVDEQLHRPSNHVYSGLPYTR